MNWAQLMNSDLEIANDGINFKQSKWQIPEYSFFAALDAWFACAMPI
jgi:hypothetical protein